MEKFINDLGLKTIDGWLYQQEIGGGKASLTLLYKNPKNDKSVAKFLIAPRNNDELENFQNEALALKKLNDLPKCYVPKLIRPLSKKNPYPIYFYMTEFIEGETLSNLIERKSFPWSWEESLELLCRIAFTVSQGSPMYIHRDLHPGNIMILNIVDFDKYSQSYNEPGIRVLDYGCSKDVFKGMIGEWYEDKFRHPGAISTWSPEFIKSPNAVTNSHDSWSLGILLYRFITGQYPIFAESFGELLEAYKNLSLLDDKIEKLVIPEAIKKLLRQLFKENPQERLSPNEVYYFSSDILYTNLIDLGDTFIDQYIDMRCSLSKCSCCGTLVGRNHARCYGCGIICEEDNLIHVLKRKN